MMQWRMGRQAPRRLRAASAAALACLCLAPACGRPSPAASEPDSAAAETAGTVPAAEIWADSIMASMTLEQLAGQLIYPAVYSDRSELALRSVVRYVADSHVGGVVLLKGTPEAARVIADTLSKLSSAPPFVAIDAEWGLAMRLSDTPRYPRNGRISPAAEDSLLYEYGREVARESHEVGVNMVLGPVLDVLPYDRSSRGGRFIGTRSFGSDPHRVTRLGVAYSRGLEDGGVVSVAKHFPGHGSADADSHKRLPTVSKSLDELSASDLMPFEAYVGAGLSAVMIGHLHVPALDEEVVPVSVSEKILKGWLRDRMGFDGLIVTDAMNMAGAGGKTGADAVMAGADIVLAPSGTHAEVCRLVEAVRSGEFPLADLRDRVRRVLMCKYRFCRQTAGVVRLPAPDRSKALEKSLKCENF